MTQDQSKPNRTHGFIRIGYPKEYWLEHDNVFKFGAERIEYAARAYPHYLGRWVDLECFIIKPTSKSDEQK